MTAIAMGELFNLNGKELITALLVGDDMAIRILGASGFWFDIGWDNTGTINALGATATAGRVLGLNNLQMRNAFGIVINQLAGSVQNCWDGSMTFKLPQGLSARNGIFSAQLAKEGWIGPEDALMSDCTYFRIYTEGCKNPEALTKDLGKKYYTESVFKPYPACRATHAAIECALKILMKNDIKAQNIESAILYVPLPVLKSFMGQPFHIGEFPQGNAAFNFQYMTANALLRGSANPEHLSEESIKDPEINSLTQKIRMAELPGAPELSAKLEIKMKDGQQYHEYIDTPKGDPTHNPMTQEEIKEKFRSNVDFSRAVSKKNAEKMLLLLENLEEVDNIKEIVTLTH
jgi:2-methylcitrate dehydratase PrpD